MALPSILPENLLEYDRTQFDAEMLKHANAFSVCEFWGVGQYTTQFFVDPENCPFGPCPHLLEEAREQVKRIKAVRPDARPMIYGMVVIPSGALLSILVPEHYSLVE